MNGLPAERPATGRVLVTGATGFTGRHLLPALAAKGFECWGTTTNREAVSARTVALDLRDADDVAHVAREIRPHYVIHLAAESFTAYEDDSKYEAVNVGGTENLLRGLSLLPAGHLRRVIVASSSHVYGPVDGGPITEDQPIAPQNAYARSKARQEAAARPYASRFPITITRPFNYTGRGQREAFFVPKIVACFKAREPAITVGNLDVSRDFCDVRDVSEAYAALLGTADAPATVNLCSGQATALRDIIEWATAATQHRPEIIQHDSLKRKSEIAAQWGSPQRLQTSTGWARRHDIPSTIGWMLAEA